MVKVTSNTPTITLSEVPANRGVQISQETANIINVAGQSENNKNDQVRWSEVTTGDSNINRETFRHCEGVMLFLRLDMICF